MQLVRIDISRICELRLLQDFLHSKVKWSLHCLFSILIFVKGVQQKFYGHVVDCNNNSTRICSNGIWPRQRSRVDELNAIFYGFSSVSINRSYRWSWSSWRRNSRWRPPLQTQSFGYLPTEMLEKYRWWHYWSLQEPESITSTKPSIPRNSVTRVSPDGYCVLVDTSRFVFHLINPCWHVHSWSLHGRGRMVGRCIKRFVKA